MKITCLCYTHGRAHIIGEAVESYLRQEDCGIDNELLIINDCPEQPLKCDLPNVRIKNIPMCKSVCEKFNLSIELADGEYIAIWEDDDISLPWRLKRSVEMTNGLKDNYKQRSAWYWNDGKIDKLACNLFFGNSIFRKSDWIDGGGADPNGYPDASGHLSVMKSVNKRGGYYTMEEAKPEDVFWIYRWGGIEVVHDSGFGAANNDAEKRMRRFRERTLNHPLFKYGEQVIIPQWKYDYTAQALQAAKREN